MTRYLVVAHKTLVGPDLLDLVAERARSEPCDFHLVVPAVHPSGHAWSDGEVEAAAEARLAEGLERFAEVGAPSCFAGRPAPATPQELIGFACINQRFPTHGGLYAWEFEKDGRELRVRVEGRLVFNGIFQVLDAALAGFGLAYVPEDLARPHLAEGRLERVLDEWCPPWPGYHLYYPSRRQSSPAFALLVEALRHRGDPGGSRPL